MSSDELQSAVVLLLYGSNLSIDTTMTAPPVLGPPITSSETNPDWIACQQNQAACADLVGAQRRFCIKEAQAECANVPETVVVTQAQVFYSYLAVSPNAKQNGAADVLFPLETLYHQGSIFSFFIDINYVHTSFGFNVTAGFLPGATIDAPPSVWLGLSGLVSNSPTIILNGDSTLSPPYPDIDLTDMNASVTLAEVRPTADGKSVDYGSVSSYFGFQWDVTDIPDWLADAFVDVQGKVESHVTSRINAAFDAPSSHAALSKALGTLITNDVAKAHPAGLSTITNVVGVGSSWTVYYIGN